MSDDNKDRDDQKPWKEQGRTRDTALWRVDNIKDRSRNYPGITRGRERGRERER